jgi:hypothetical protein
MPNAAQPRAPLDPTLVALAVVAGAYALLFLLALAFQVPVQLVEYFERGIDFADFRQAARDVLDGLDPYGRARFVTPPPSLVPFLPFALIPQGPAALVFMAVNVAALAGGLVLLARRLALAPASVAGLVLVAGLSPSTLMLVERGNVDGLVFLLLCAFVTAPRGRLAPLWIALGAGIKAYPALFLASLIARGRVRAALAGAAIGLALLLACLVAWPDFPAELLRNQASRGSAMRLDENLSPLAVFWLIDGELLQTSARPAVAAGVALYLGLLGACLVLDRRLAGRLSGPDETFLTASLVAFCLGLPALVYLYSGVVLLIALAALAVQGVGASAELKRRQAVCLGLAMLPAQSFALTLAPTGAAHFGVALNVVPPLACLMLCVQALAFRLDFAKALAPQAEARAALA